MIEGLSGFVLCYGPLLLMFVGFIVAAAVTDADMRRTYLRNLDPSSDDERAPFPAPTALAEPKTFRTPSGGKVTLTASSLIKSIAPVAPVASAAEKKGVPAPVKAGETDNLQKIEGIGPKMNGILNAAGIQTFAQLAAKSADELKAILTAGGASAVNDPSSWPEQAGLAAAGKWDDLQVLQDSLKGGRKTA